PNIDLRISASLQHVDLTREDIDLAVRHGNGDWPELHVTRICAEELFPACSPMLLQTSPPIRTPAELAGHDLGHDPSRTRWRGLFLLTIEAANGGATGWPSLELSARMQSEDRCSIKQRLQLTPRLLARASRWLAALWHPST